MLLDRNPVDSRVESDSIRVGQTNLGPRQNLRLAPNLIPRVELRQATGEFSERPVRPEQELPEPGSLTIDTNTREAAWAAASRPYLCLTEGLPGLNPVQQSVRVP